MDFLDRAIASGAQASARIAYQQIEWAREWMSGAELAEAVTFWQERAAHHAAVALQYLGV